MTKATHRVLDKLNIENRTLTRITGAAEREQHRLINERALREALINAMVHNDYTAEVFPVVEIYVDRISITSYGGLVSGLSREEFLAGRSMLRNRELMRVFRDLDLVEQMGSGIHRILSAYGSDIFHISEHFFEICFPLPGSQSTETAQANPGVEAMAESRAESESGAESRAESRAESEAGAESRAESGAESSIEKILFLLRDTPLSKSELALKLGLNTVTGALNRSVNALLEDERIERTIPEKPKSRLQKYRLTQVGRQWLELDGIGAEGQKATGGGPA